MKPGKGGGRGLQGPALTQGQRVVWDRARAGDESPKYAGREGAEAAMAQPMAPAGRALLLPGHCARFWERSRMVTRGHCSGPRCRAQRCPRSMGWTAVSMQEKYPLEGTVRSCVGAIAAAEQDLAHPTLLPAIKPPGYPSS